MIHLSIYWEHDSDELIDMLQALDDPGETVGNEGAELLVSEDEYSAIRSYIEQHPTELSMEVYNENITKYEAEELRIYWHSVS